MATLKRSLLLPSAQETCIHFQTESFSGGAKEISVERVIRIKNLTPRSDITKLAKDVVSSARSLFSSEREDEIANLVHLLQKRATSAPRSPNRMQLSKSAKDTLPSFHLSSKSDREASVDKIDEYLESLYDEVAAKIVTSREILALVQDFSSLPVLVANETIIPALARVLREDGKKSIELASNISLIFLVLSHYEALQTQLTKNKLGTTCLKLAENEERRYDLWHRELEDKLEKNSLDSSNAQLEKTKFQSMVYKQEKLMFTVFHLLFNMAVASKATLVKMLKANVVSVLVSFFQRQASFLPLQYVVVNFLALIAAYKESKRALLLSGGTIIQSTMSLLAFVTKPSFENTDWAVVRVACNLLLNLAHFKRFRQLIIKKKCHLALAALLNTKDSHTLQSLFDVFYLLAMDDWAADALAETNVLLASNQYVIANQSSLIESPAGSAASLSLTLSTSVDCICACLNKDRGASFRGLIAHGLDQKNCVALRIVKTATTAMTNAKNSKFSQILLEFIPQLTALATRSKQPDLVAEALALIGCLKSSKFDWSALASESKLLCVASTQILCFLGGQGQSYSTSSGGRLMLGLGPNDDAILEWIILCGVIANYCAAKGWSCSSVLDQVHESNFVQLLLKVCVQKENDDELIYQSLLVVASLVKETSIADSVAASEEWARVLLDLAEDENESVAGAAGYCFDLLMVWYPLLCTKFLTRNEKGS